MDLGDNEGRDASAPVDPSENAGEPQPDLNTFEEDRRILLNLLLHDPSARAALAAVGLWPPQRIALPLPGVETSTTAPDLSSGDTGGPICDSDSADPDVSQRDASNLNLAQGADSDSSGHLNAGDLNSAQADPGHRSDSGSDCPNTALDSKSSGYGGDAEAGEEEAGYGSPTPSVDLELQGQGRQARGGRAGSDCPKPASASKSSGHGGDKKEVQEAGSDCLTHASDSKSSGHSGDKKEVQEAGSDCPKPVSVCSQVGGDKKEAGAEKEGAENSRQGEDEHEE